MEGEQFRSSENFPERDFLDPEMRLTMSMSDEAFQHLPEISREDLQAKRERYRGLLGTWQLTPEEATAINVEAVIEFPDQPEFYIEGENQVQKISVPAIERFVASLKERMPEYAHLHLIGELHTHPVTQQELDPEQRPWHLSEDDKESLIKTYEQGHISSNKPFISGIVGQTEQGRTGYAFYRLVRVEKGYAFQEVPWPQTQEGTDAETR